MRSRKASVKFSFWVAEGNYLHVESDKEKDLMMMMMMKLKMMAEFGEGTVQF